MLVKNFVLARGEVAGVWVSVSVLTSFLFVAEFLSVLKLCLDYLPVTERDARLLVINLKVPVLPDWLRIRG